jgi:hypothetical protein
MLKKFVIFVTCNHIDRGESLVSFPLYLDYAAVRQQLVILFQQILATDAPPNSFKRKDWRISFVLSAQLNKS